MAKFPALPLFTDAILGDTLHLTNAQFGSYLLLLIIQWRSKDCSLPDDDVFLAKVARMDKRTWLNNRSTIMSFFQRGSDGRLRQLRLVDERNYVEHLRNKNVAAGKSSALKRKERHSTSVQPNVNETSTPTPTPTVIREREPDPLMVPPGFEIFWSLYPKDRAGNKQRAASAYCRALSEKRALTEGEIHEGLKKYLASDEVAGGYAKNAAGWLDDDRWKNNYSTKPNNGTGNSPRGFPQNKPAVGSIVEAGLRVAARYKKETQ